MNSLQYERDKLFYFYINETSKYIFRSLYFQGGKIFPKKSLSGKWQFEDFPDRNDPSLCGSSVTEDEDSNDIYFD